MFIEFSLKAVGPSISTFIFGQLDTPMICIILYKSLDTHKKKTHMVVTKNEDGMDLYTMRKILVNSLLCFNKVQTIM